MFKNSADLKSSLQARETDAEVERKFWQVVSLVEKMKVLDAATEMVDSLEKEKSSESSLGLIRFLDESVDFFYFCIRKNEECSPHIHSLVVLHLWRK